MKNQVGTTLRSEYYLSQQAILLATFEEVSPMLRYGSWYKILTWLPMRSAHNSRRPLRYHGTKLEQLRTTKGCLERTRSWTPTCEILIQFHVNRARRRYLLSPLPLKISIEVGFAYAKNPKSSVLFSSRYRFVGICKNKIHLQHTCSFLKWCMRLAWRYRLLMMLVLYISE